MNKNNLNPLFADFFSSFLSAYDIKRKMECHIDSEVMIALARKEQGKGARFERDYSQEYEIELSIYFCYNLIKN